MRASTILLKSKSDFPRKVEEMKVLYPSKEIAMIKVDEALAYLQNVRIYRQYTDDNDVFYRQVVLHIQLKEYLKQVPDWAKVAESVEADSYLFKIFTLINNWPLKAIIYLVDKFQKLISRIRHTTSKKPKSIKKKYKNF